MVEERRSEQSGERDPERIAHFRIVGRIGRGGMGIVYRAQDERLARPVALKVLPPGFEQDRDRRSRFLREARAAAAVAHPNIATVHEIGEEDGRVFIAMELVEGVTLRSMLENGPLPPASVVRIGLQIARALAKAHAAGVVHRDLKPDNVMIGEDLHAKVLDFGLAKVTGPGASGIETPSAIERGETATREGVLLGTPQYMSPEQAKGRPIDARSDVFSLGIVLYEMVAGKRPFDGVSVAEVIIAIDRDPPPPLASVVRGVPWELVRVIDRCLEKDPARRYADGKGVAEDLAAPASAPAQAPAPAAWQASAPPTPAPTPPLPTVPMSIATPGPAQMAEAAKPKRKWLRYVILAVVALAVIKPFRTGCGGGSGGSGGRGGGNHSPPTGSAALPPEAASIVAAAMKLASSGGPLLACPPLVAKGVEEPSGWLGAAASDVACRRAAILAGGNLDRVVVPAELLDLPRQPTDDFPRDPYGAAGARDRAVAAAKKRATMWLDGTVEKTAGGFKVALTLRSHDDDDDLESAEGTGHHVYLAVRDAMHHLVQEEALSRATHVDEDIAKWTGIKDVDLALAWDDWHDSLASSAASTAAALDELRARRSDLGPLWTQAQVESQVPLLVESEHFDPVSLDRSSPAAFARSAVPYCQTVRTADCAALAAEARKYRDAESSPVGRRTLLLAQAQLAFQAGDPRSALELALGELREEPRSDHTWETPYMAALGQPAYGPIARAMAAWVPEDHAAYNAIATGDAALPDAAARLPYARRAYDISPDFPLWSGTLGKLLVELGRREEARSVA
ncbi:MAG TPA: protein kinase, partial [Polyangiaceae bacterium]